MSTPNWVVIQTVLSDDQKTTPYYLSASLESVLPTAWNINLQTAASETPGPGMLWMFTFDNGNMGRIRSGWNGGLVLSVDGNNNLVLEIEEVPTPPRQQWNLNAAWNDQGNGMGLYSIQNVQSGYMAVNPCTLTEVTNATLVSVGQTVQNNYYPPFQWFLAPNNILQEIAALPNYNGGSSPSFPAFTDGQQPEAYVQISNAIYSNANGDIRSLYIGNDVYWGDVYTNLKTPPVSDNSGGSGIDDGDWMAVVTQLRLEVQYLGDIHLLLDDVNGLTGLTGTDNLTVYNQVIADLGLTTSSTNTVVMQMMGIFEALALSVLSATGAGGCIAAGMIQAAISLNNISSPSAITPPKAIALDELWSNLALMLSGDKSTGAQGIFKLLSDYFNVVFTDWNKLQATNSLIGTGTWPVTLLTTTNTIPDALSASAPVFQLIALQAVMPTMFQIYIIDDDINGFPSYVPDYAQYTGTGKKMFVAGSDSPTTQIPQKVIDDLWGPDGAGVAQADFFGGSNGWYLPRSYQGKAFGYSTQWTLTIANTTPNILNVNLIADWPSNQYDNQSSQVFPNESCTFLGDVTSSTVPGSPTEYMGYSCSVNEASVGTVLRFSFTNSGGGALEHATITISGANGNSGYSSPLTISGTSTISHDTTAAGIVPVFFSK